MSNHTPGPWRRNVAGHNEDSWRIISESKATGYIAFIPPEHEDAEANSRLIAAAPELLEVLKTMVEPGHQPKHLTKAQWENLPWIVAAHVAIAKAEGREV